MCRDFALNYNEEYKRVGDLGGLGGKYKDYEDNLKDLLQAHDWEYTNILLNLNDNYVGNPQAENTVFLQNLEEISSAYKLCRTGNPQVYLPRELVALIHIDDTSFIMSSQEKPDFRRLAQEPKLPTKQEVPVEAVDIWKMSQEERLKFIKSRKEQKEAPEDEELASKKLTIIDVKTGLPYSLLEKRIKEFERTLQNPNVDLIQGIVSGDPETLLRGDHIITRGDPEKTKAKIYMALIGLQSFRKRAKKDRKVFRDYLSIIHPKLESDATKLEELLMFFITSKRKLFEI